MKKLKLCLITLSSILMCFCTNQKLSKENALEILKRDFKEKCYQGLISDNIYYYGNYYQKVSKSNEEDIAEIHSYIMELKKQGCATSVEDKPRYMQFTLTSKGKRYQSSKKDRIGKLFEVATSEVVEVLGISENKNTGTAIVKFSFKYKPSPFYNLRRYKYKFKHKDTCKDKFYEQEVEFIKFDDRWEIKK